MKSYENKCDVIMENADALVGKRACCVCRHRIGSGYFGGEACGVSAVQFVDLITGRNGLRRIFPCLIARHTPLCRFEPADWVEEHRGEKGES